MAETVFKLIKASRLIDGKGGPVVSNGAVLLEGDKIRAAGPGKTVAAPGGAKVEVLDYTGKTVLPGLVDCHVHLNGFGDGRSGDELATLPDEVLSLQSAKNARTHLYSGVTTVRDCGGKNKTIFMLRKAIEMGITPGPSMVITGRPMAIVGGHLSYFGIQATGVTECRAAVRQLIKEGADFIKITASGGSTKTSFPLRPSFNVDELKAIAEEAHKFGKHTAAHCVNIQSMHNCLDAGIDTIIHARHIQPDGTWEYRPEVTERMVKQGVYVNLTLNESRAIVQNLEKKIAAGITLTAWEEKLLEGCKAKWDDLMDHAGRIYRDGAKLVAGSDSSWSVNPMGNFQGELEAHVMAGMKPMEAIVAGTLDSAKSCWTDKSVGSLEAGKEADVLVVDGDPSKNISDLHKVVDVFLKGAKVDRKNYV